jgi:hypothetical protein
MNLSAIQIIASQGYLLSKIQLPQSLLEAVRAQDWNELDRLIRMETLPGGAIFDELRNYAEFSEIEFIISVRSSLKEPDEDGIWHDDGSRVLAFSLSLTLDSQGVGGGVLEMRKRGDIHGHQGLGRISTPPYGTLIVFATGTWGFEHKINKVTAGERIIIAGWCT